ncbi:hypothetical protein E4P40_24530 [Blastococcus sp. CT_GayMR20]|uniref:hypothetical protein n=1 Tax=Blastococcus sp. CT_GayMR20 TaxID=2559609 RepID=UPI00107328F9|nr:hypothetical protein [Blastococcus sp. CT_GayMR20]TFV67160.1 hypothetical protein E4P40_24530 [Blastococcus sp. CT_GayMR20]
MSRGVVLLVVLLGVLLGLPAQAGAADDGAATAADRVVVVGVPGLTWTDVDPQGTPELWALAGDSTIGAMSVRAARSTTCVLDGWATLGAGNRARVPGPDEGLPPVPLPTVPLPEDPAAPTIPPPADGTVPEQQVDTSLSYCGLQERAAKLALQEPEATVQRTAADEGTARFGAEPGALGEAVGCATVSGRAATLAAAAPGVAITRADTLPSDPAPLAQVLSGCPLALVTLNQLTDAGRPGAEKTDDGTDPEPRAAALLRIDQVVGQLRAALATMPGETLLLLAGISEVNDGRPQLHVGMASGPGFTADAWLTSASTGRAPFGQLIDVAPTALQALGLEQPASMNGQPLHATGERPALESAVTDLEAVNTAATIHHRNTGFFFWTLVIVSAVVVSLGMLLLGGVPRLPSRPSALGRRALRVLAIAAAGLPVATYLAGFVPWERSGVPALALSAAVLGADLVVLAVALGGPWRRHRLGPPLAVLALTFGTLVGDVLTGSRLELNGLLGYDAIVAGRFTGYGNLSFGLLSVSALLVTAALASAVGRRVAPDRARVATGGTVLAIGVATVLLIGAPGLGRDFGGVLAALPGFLLLAMLLTHIRVTVVRLVAILAAAVVTVGTLAYLDWLRPAADRTHLGRFVEQVLTGEAWTVISRKGQANLDILTRSPLAWMLPVAIVAAVWLVRPGGLLRSPAGGGPAGLHGEDVAVLRSGLLAGLLSLVIGAAVNDSGVALPAAAAALLVPLTVWLAAGTPSGGTGKGGVETGGTPRSGPAEGAERVTVVSRGSTVWNT